MMKANISAVFLLAVVGMAQAAAPVGDTIWLYSVSTSSYAKMEPANYQGSSEYDKRLLWGPFAGTRPAESDE